MTTKRERDEWRKLAEKAALRFDEDADSFVVAARTAVPALLDEVERLREALRTMVVEAEWAGDTIENAAAILADMCEDDESEEVLERNAELRARTDEAKRLLEER